MLVKDDKERFQVVIRKNVTTTLTVEGVAAARELNAPKTMLFEAFESDDYIPRPSHLFARAALWLQESQDYTTILATNFQYENEDGFYMCLTVVVE